MRFSLTIGATVREKKVSLKLTQCVLTILLLCFDPTVYCWPSNHYLSIKHSHFISLFCVCYWRVSGWNAVESIFLLRRSKSVSTVIHLSSNRWILIFMTFYCFRHKRWQFFHIAARLSCMLSTAQNLSSFQKIPPPLPISYELALRRFE